LFEVKFATGDCAYENIDEHKRRSIEKYRKTFPFPGNGVSHFFPACVSRGRISLCIKQSGFVIRYAIIFIL
jgi:hypothetical protein